MGIETMAKSTKKKAKSKNFPYTFGEPYDVLGLWSADDIKLEPRQNNQTQKVAAMFVCNGNGDKVASFQIGRAAQLEDYMLAFASYGYRFATSELENQMVIQREQGGSARPVEEGHEAMLLMDMKKCLMTSVMYTKYAMRAQAKINKYHPVKSWFAELEPYNPSEGSYISKLLDHITFAKGHEDIGRIYFRKWLIGCIRRLHKGKQNPAIVWDGAQEKGKSSFVKWLAVKSEWFVDSAPSADNKDDFALQCTRFIWEFAEMDATTKKAQVAALKAFITRESVTFRVPHDKYAITRPALANFFGTVNHGKDSLLKDQSGSRRFWVTEVTGIDFDYYEKIDNKDIWREAAYLYEIGESADLSKEENKLRIEINEDYQDNSPVVEWVSEVTIVTGDKGDSISKKDLRQRFHIYFSRAQDHKSKAEINGYFLKMGCQLKRLGKKKVESYIGVKFDD